MAACDLGIVRYLNLCTQGQHSKQLIDSDMGRLKTVVYLLQDAEDQHPATIPRYRAELVQLRAQLNRKRGSLMQHVAHCTVGCERDARTGLSNSAFTHGGAPSHDKPLLPSMEAIASRLRNGEALEAIAAKYDRHPSTLQGRLSLSGFSSRDGRPTSRTQRQTPSQPRFALASDEPWRGDAVCAQTDPEAFFPEKGGSTREAKAVCARCLVAAEGLDSALRNEERFGIWGGLSERERRKITRSLQESA